MTSNFAQAAYAEDQRYSHTILTFHVLRAGSAAGAILSLPIGLGYHLLSPQSPSLLHTLFVSSARGTLGGLALSFVALHGRMRGRDEVEWQDRAWRLLANRGQVEVDGYIIGGALGGAVSAVWAARRGRLPPSLAARSFTTGVGGAGIGMAGGTAAYLGWRYGIKGGKWEEAVVGMEEGARAAKEGVVEEATGRKRS